MSTSNTSNDDDYASIPFNISEAENKQPFHDLEEFTREYAPEHMSTMVKLLSGEDVNTGDIHKIMHALLEVEMPYITKNGISNSKMAHLDDTLRRVGGQL